MAGVIELAPVGDGVAPTPAPGVLVEDADHPLWIATNHARLAEKHRADKTRVHTLKFHAATPGPLDVSASGGTPTPSSPSTQLRRDQLVWERGGHETAAAVQEEDEEPVLSLDEDDLPRAARRRRRLSDEEHKEAEEVDRGTERKGPRRRGRRSLVQPSPNEHCAGSIPSIVIDPSCSLLVPLHRPHLKPDPTMASVLASSTVAPAQPAPAIWATDYARHTVRCILADGRIHTVAGGGGAGFPPSPSAVAGSPPVDAALSGFSDGTGTLSSLFAKPRGLALHPLTGELFVADSANHCIRVVTSPTLVASALKLAGQQIEASSSFRPLRDPTVDPLEEEAREKQRACAAEKKKRTASAGSAPSRLTSFPTPELAGSLRLVLSLFLPLVVDYVGFEVRTIAGTPGCSGAHDTLLGAHGRIVKQARFKFPIGLCLRMTGAVEEDDPLADADETREPQATPKSSYELLVSDAGNGCIRRIRPNPFGPPRAGSPSLAGRASPSSDYEAEYSHAHDRGFIVETIRAFMPVRCCQTSWSSAIATEEKEKGSGDDTTGATSGGSASSSPSFGATLLDELSSSPARLLQASPSRDYLQFDYPIGIALRYDRRRMPIDFAEQQTQYGTIYTTGAVTSPYAGSQKHKSTTGASEDDPPARSHRMHAGACSLIIVDARASCVYSMDLTMLVGSVKRLAGSDDGGWGFLDGSGSRARFCRPSGAAVCQRTGSIFVADAGNSCVRVIAPHSNRVSTLAGHPHRVGCVDGPAFAASLYAPLAVALTPCPFFPNEHEQVLWVAGGFRQGLRKVVRCDCVWTYDTA